MAPKLSDSDKNTIVELYQHPDESTATLASRYGVSSSTISRILKQALSEDTYQEIVKQKKGGGSKPQGQDSKEAQMELEQGIIELNGETILKMDTPVSESRELEPEDKDEHGSTTNQEEGEPVLGPISIDVVSPKADARPFSRIRPRGAMQLNEGGQPEPIAPPNNRPSPSMAIDAAIAPEQPTHYPIDTTIEAEDSLQLSISPLSPAPPILKKSALAPDNIHDEEEMDEGDDWDDELGDDLLDDDLDDDLDGDLDDDDEADHDDDSDLAFTLNADMLSVLPFSEAKLPRTCYIIIDRAAELITRPLKAFSELGEVPEEDVDAQTLPIFDNHRVAKRFVNRRTQRIVKVPDAQVLRKTSSYLMDKGITRLLLGGQVYSLMDDEEGEDYDDNYN